MDYLTGSSRQSSEAVQIRQIKLSKANKLGSWHNENCEEENQIHARTGQELQLITPGQCCL
jgi:hypothetical protein